MYGVNETSSDFLKVSGIYVCSLPTVSKMSSGPESPLLSLACHGNLIAAGTELRNSQALVIVWYSPQEDTTIEARAKE